MGTSERMGVMVLAVKNSDIFHRNIITYEEDILPVWKINVKLCTLLNLTLIIHHKWELIITISEYIGHAGNFL